MSKLRSSIKKYLLEERKRGTLIGRIGGSWIDRRREQRYERFAALPVDRDLIVFECFKGNKYTDSPKAIYEYLLGHEEYKRFRFVWCFRGGSPDSAAGSTAGTAASPLEEFAYLADDVRTEIVRWGSEEYYRTYAAAAYWITNARLPKAISKKPGQIYVQCWHGTPLKKLGCDITTEATESAEVTREVIHGDASRYDYLISPSRFCSEKLSSAFDLRALGKENIILEVGYPRNDSLALFAAEESQIPEETSEMITTGIKTLSYHEQAEALRQSLGIPPGNKTILYAPTYRENKRAYNGEYEYEEPLDLHRLKEDLGDGYTILFRTHYFIKSGSNSAAGGSDEYDDFIVDVSGYPEINDLYMIADMLVTDYSSVFFDYANLKRPVIFYMYDLDFYRDDLRGLYLGLDDLPGPVAVNQEELTKYIQTAWEWASAPEWQARYAAFNARFNYLDDGCAARRAAEAVLSE